MWLELRLYCHALLYRLELKIPALLVISVLMDGFALGLIGAFIKIFWGNFFEW
jgi:hypothetical protein